MASTWKILERKREVTVDYFRLTREAEAARERERKAAVTIEAAWRGHTIRRNLRELEAATLTIQCYWRGYLGRQRFSYARAEADKKLRKAYFDVKATQIQRIWRGFFSRKYIHSFYARKAYLLAVNRKNQEMRVLVEDSFHSSLHQQQRQLEEAAQKMFIAKLCKMGHTLSTHAQAGIFNSPFAHISGSIPTVNNRPLEDHIRETVRSATKLPPVRRRRNLPVDKLPVMPELGQAADTPAYAGKQHRMSLRACFPYDLPHQAQLLEQRVHDQMIAVHHSQRFSGCSPSGSGWSQQPGGLRPGVAWRDPADPAIGHKTEQMDERIQSISDKQFQRHWRAPSLLGDTVEVPI